MLTLLILSVLFYAFATKSATEEVAWTWPYRNLGEVNFDGESRRLWSRLAHHEGAKSIFIIAVIIAALYSQVQVPQFHWGRSLAAFGIGLASTLFVYWYRFDTAYALGLGQKWWYLGDTADTDNWLRRFGGNVGKRKAYFCIAMVTVLHIASYFLLGLF